MKRLSLTLFFFSLFLVPTMKASAQVQELEQLALDIEKLAQMKSILQEMYKGYQILTQGYNAVKNLAQGNFDLHSAFLNSLLAVNPSVKNYVRVADIISSQATLVKEYKAALSNFTGSHIFSVSELNYFSNVYGNLADKSLDNLNELLMVLTDNQLRMSDAERITTIDHLYTDMKDKLAFLRQFNSRAGVLAAQRQHQLEDVNKLKNLFGQ
jgi:DNA repair ATPase RecN